MICFVSSTVQYSTVWRPCILMLGCEELSSLLVFLSYWLCVIFTSEPVRLLPLTRFVGVNPRPNSSKEIASVAGVERGRG